MKRRVDGGGYDVVDFNVTSAPKEHMGPFIMTHEGGSALCATVDSACRDRCAPDHGRIVGMQRSAGIVEAARAHEVAGLDLEHVVLAVAVLIDPFAIE